MKDHFLKKKRIAFRDDVFTKCLYRPFTLLNYYGEKMMSDRLTANHYDAFGKSLASENLMINIAGTGASKEFQVLACKTISSFDLLEKTQCLPLYRYDATGTRHDNITDWGLQQFRQRYCPEAPPSEGLGRLDIFHYTYAVLHDPAYRTKYELNLKREFPRLPFYAGFWQWAAWGQQLMDLHLHYESAGSYPLKRTDVPLAVGRARSATSKEAMMQLSMIAGMLQGETSKTDKLVQPKCKLKANKEEGKIEIDEVTTLSGIPAAAWDYKLGNRSALEWVLDQYKEKKPKDPTIREKFNTYRFADYKEEVIELLKKVCTVSVGTMEVVKKMG